MFNIGGGEILVILLLALLVLGPQRLPDAARQAGKAMGELRRLSTGFQNELKQAMDEPSAPTKTAATTTSTTAAEAAPAAETAKKATSPAARRPRRAAPLKANGHSAS